LLARLTSPDAPLPMGTLAVPLGAGFQSGGDDVHPTTLSSAAGVTLPSAGERPRKRHIWIGLAGTVAVAVAIAITIVMNGGKEVQPVERPAHPVEPPAAPAPAPAVAPVVDASRIVDSPQPIDAGIDAAKPKPARARSQPSSDDLYDDR
jgi:hypothetical protein